ncbi:MAG: phosphatase PAP2 family protein [Proteobacteria bacterium]|nr:phosphatase PAP2 family protein [Pseudomonadota bacterium]
MKETHALRRHFLGILIPGFLYPGLFFSRPLWFHPRCAATPSPCTPDGLNGIDQIALSHHSVFADFCSNILQNSVGVAAFVLPWILIRPWPKALRLNLTLLSITLWNAVSLEAVRALVQRPRPQVFAAPLSEGLNIHLYTSFYSGHTSFVALATGFTVLWLGSSRPESRILKGAALLLAVLLTAATGVLRVMGGRHFPTDVIAGALIGTGICILTYRRLEAN